jgi:hypothetical protein
MIDNDGTPLAKKAETISYSDIYSTPDDKPRVSINKAYAAGTGYVDDPSYKEAPKKLTFLQKAKVAAQSSVNTAKVKFKETVTVENAKKAGVVAGRYGMQIARNVERNVKEDAEEGKKELKEAYHNYAPKMKPLKTPKTFKMRSRRPSQMSEEELTYAIKHGKGKMPEKTPEVFKTKETKTSKASRVLKTIARGSKNIIESEGKHLKQTAPTGVSNMFENKKTNSNSIFVTKPKQEKHIKRKRTNNDNIFNMKGGNFKW